MGWTPPRRPWCARVMVLVTTEQEASVSEVSTIGLDLAKRVFQAHGADASGKVVFRKRLRREQVLAFFAGRAACVVAMEACSSAHYWAREIGELGHTVRLIPPAYVKPFVKRQKNDTTDAEAICEAAQRPSRPMPLYSELGIFWCGSGRRRSTPCVAISGNMGWLWPKVPVTSRSSSHT